MLKLSLERKPGIQWCHGRGRLPPRHINFYLFRNFILIRGIVQNYKILGCKWRNLEAKWKFSTSCVGNFSGCLSENCNFLFRQFWRTTPLLGYDWLSVYDSEAAKFDNAGTAADRPTSSVQSTATIGATAASINSRHISTRAWRAELCARRVATEPYSVVRSSTPCCVITVILAVGYGSW